MLIPMTIQSEDGEEELTVYEGLEDGKAVKCGGIITAVKRMNTKVGNKEMAVVTVEDLFGNFEVLVFPKIYEKFKHMLHVDAMMTFVGKLSIKEGDRPIVLPDDIIPWETKKPTTQDLPKKVEPQKITKLYLKFDLTDDNIKNNIISVLSRYPGNHQVVVKCCKQNKAFMLPFKVDGSTALQNELFGYLEPENIVLA